MDEYDGCANNPCHGTSCRDLNPAEEEARGEAYECGPCTEGYVSEDGICQGEWGSDSTGLLLVFARINE